MKQSQTHNDITDKQLVARAQNGDGLAVAQLYDRYAPAMYRYCFFQTNKSRELAEDLTHDIFIEMSKSLKNFKGEGSFKNWLYTIAKRQVNKWVKQKYQASFSPLYENIVEEEYEEDPEVSQEKQLTLERVLQHIKPKAAQILRLRFLRNYSVAETAAAVGATETNVKVITHRSLKRLQEFSYEL